MQVDLAYFILFELRREKKLSSAYHQVQHKADGLTIGDIKTLEISLEMIGQLINVYAKSSFYHDAAHFSFIYICCSLFYYFRLKKSNRT